MYLALPNKVWLRKLGGATPAVSENATPDDAYILLQVHQTNDVYIKLQQI